MKISPNELTLDETIYARQKKSPTTVGAYSEALGIGAKFPAIEVQRVNNYPDKEAGADAILIIDGYHRQQAYIALEITEIEAVEWQADVALDYETNIIALGLESAERNIRHGNRLAESDKEAKAQEVAELDPDKEWTEEMIAQKLGASQQSVSNWISAIRARQSAGRDGKIARLSRLGWTQEEIAEKLGLTQQRVQQITNFTSFGKICNLLSEGRDMAYIADYYHIDLAFAWALRLESREDKWRIHGEGGKSKEGSLEWGLRAYDDWRFQDRDKRFGDKWPGAIPAQLVAHTLYFFTQQGDLVLDPMAGGGVVPDVCLVFGRRCRSYDLSIRDTRPEIEQHYWDPDDLQWPASCKKKPDLIFFDPPYFTKMAKDYESESISSLSRAGYMEFLANFLALIHHHSKPSTRLAFLNAGWRDFQSKAAIDENSEKAIFVYQYANMLVKSGWTITHEIQCPLSNSRFNGGIHSAMQEKRELGTVNRTLLMAQRGE